MEEEVAPSKRYRDATQAHISGALLPALDPEKQIGIISSNSLVVFPGVLC